MVRGLAISFFMGLGVLGSGSLRAEFPFQLPPVNYYDAGESLSNDAQRYLRNIIGERLIAIQGKVSQIEDTESAIDEAKRQSLINERARARMFGTVGLFSGGTAGFLLLWGLSPSLSLPAQADTILKVTATVIGSLNGWSMGLAWASRERSNTPKQYRIVIDGRGEELLKAAEDLSAQIRGMAAPRLFWSMRRLQDFTRRIVAFMALEHLLLREMNQITDDMKSALHELNLDRLLFTDSAGEQTEIEIDSLRTQIIRRFRQLEYHTLKNVAQIYDDEVKIPFQKIDYSKLTERQCIAVLKWILSDPYTNERDLPDLTDQL